MQIHETLIKRISSQNQDTGMELTQVSDKLAHISTMQRLLDGVKTG